MMHRTLVYLGTPEMAVAPLRALVEAGHDIVLVVTGADKKRGRGGALSPSPVKAAALELGLRVSHDIDDVVTCGAELGVVVAFGRLIRPHVLAAVPMVNLHFSLLPRWRGAAPVERALLAGDTETGVCLMQLDEGLDTGPVYSTVRVPLSPDVTADELRRALVEVGCRQLVDALAAPLGAAEPQKGDVVYAEKIRPEELRIDWNQPVDAICRLVRLGGAWTRFRDKRVKVLAAVPDGAAGAPAPGLRLLTVQPEGKGPMDAADWLRGARPDIDERFE